MSHNDRETLRGFSRDDGMRVPDGYFADFAARMQAALPEQPWEAEAAGDAAARIAPRSFWQRVRPYVYMAAMFAGVWCMMKMFDIMRPAPASFTPEGNSVLAESISDDSFMSDYFITDVDESDLYDNLYNDGFIPASFSY
ncbi:hypothetical protein [uncultured Duncaniella sp.]|uniref:hypothetical protein n=1 Tax=uncultured Duncaniella sp. TaxID=2768039 RepID=UPI0026E56EAB|nr:hypothetical protein [uncultured Duncaniella sp.]